MGGDRTCPDSCLLAVWHGLPDDQKTKERRRPIVEQLAKQGYTQDAIATQLGVSQKTISNDLETLVSVTNVKGQGKDTRGRKRSTGRPRGGPKPERRTTTPAIEATAASLVLDQGKTYDQVKQELGLQSVNTVKTAVAREEGRRDPHIDRSELSQTAQQKLDAALRQHKAKFEASFYERVNARVNEFVNEAILPDWKKKIAEAHKLYEKRRALMDKETFNTIRRALHPDSRQSISDAKLGHAFDAFMALEKYLLNEKDSPTAFGDTLPRTWADWERAKQKATAERRARRGHSSLRPR